MPEAAQSPTASSKKTKKGKRGQKKGTGTFLVPFLRSRVSNESLIYKSESLVKINVKLFASIRKFSDKDNLEINIEEGSTVKDLLSRIGIPQDEPLLVILNEYTRGKETLIQDGDTLCLFPIIAGG